MSHHNHTLVWSSKARSDLLTIWHWGATYFSSDIADGHLRDIDHATNNLTTFPLVGTQRDEIVQGIRSIVVYPTVIFYRIKGPNIEVIRVVDGRRNIAAIFSQNITATSKDK